MCGRFTLRTPPGEWVQQLFGDFEFLDVPRDDEFKPRYNVAPSQGVLAVVGDDSGERLRAAEMHWGLLPGWAKERSVGYRMINARSETAAEKRSFQKPLRSQRCVIVADGYYEWKKVPDGKQPFWIRPNSGDCFLMAGLWEVNAKIEQGTSIVSTTVLTGQANESMASIHDRMPMVIEQQNLKDWLRSDLQDLDQVSALWTRVGEDYFTASEVSRYVNNARNEGAECIHPFS